MKAPLVSVLIPCHNAARWITETIASVRAQAESGFRIEIIIVDDGSTDGSVDVIKRAAGSDLLLVRQPSAGAAAARQSALARAQGNFIQYLDADDLLAPGKIAAQLRRLDSASETVATARWHRFTAALTADTAAARPVTEPNWRDFAPLEYLTTTFRYGAMMHPAAWLSPRAVIERAGPWDPTLSLDDDGEYFTRVVLASKQVNHCPDAVTLYRSHVAGSLSTSRSPAAWGSALTACERSTDAVLSRDSGAGARNACALYFLRVAFAAYPDAPGVTKAAVRRARALDPSARVPAAGPMFERVALVVGWRAARRLQRWSQCTQAGAP